MFTVNKYLLYGIVFAVPFFALNALVVTGAPVIELLRLEGHTTVYEQYLILGLLFLVLVGGIISLYPVLKTRRLMILNIVLSAFLISFALMAGYGLGMDVYHCDILRIPNCD